MSDGTINLFGGRFKTKEAADRRNGLGSVFGLHHFGFWVKNQDETRRKLREAGAEYLFTVDKADYFEEKYKRPDAVTVEFPDAVGLQQHRYRRRTRDILNFSGLTCHCRLTHKR